MKQLVQMAKLFAILLLITSLNACGPETETVTINENLVKNYNSDVPIAWNNMFLEVERYAKGYRPTPAPRALGYMGLAAYEGCISGMPEYLSQVSRYPGLNVPKTQSGKEYHWPTVINTIYADLMPRFFPTAETYLLDKMTALEKTLDYQQAQDIADEVFLRSKDYGKSVADAFWAWETTDVVGHDAYKDPFGTYDWESHWNNEDGKYRLTSPGPAQPTFSYWGDVRPFAINKSERLCKAPISFSKDPKSAFYAQAIETFNNCNPAQAYELKWIAEFWSDDLVDVTFSPASRWIAIASQVIEGQDANLDKSLECFAKTGMALADAVVGCWFSKYYYNVERPITFINREIDANWTTTLVDPYTHTSNITPPFPAYPSGHSTMGGAASETIASVFGNDITLSDKCHFNRTEFIGTPRTFNSLSDMASENSTSRIWLGVHFRMDSETGVDFGRSIGRKVNNLSWKKK